MAISLFSTPQSASNSTSGGTSVTVSVPSGGTVVGADTLLVLIAADRSGTPGFVTPPGFSVITSSTDLVGTDEIQGYWQNVTNGSTLPASITLAPNLGWTWAGAICVAYQGHNSASPIDSATAASTTALGSPFAASGITTGSPNEVVVWAFGVSGDVGTGTIAVSQGTIEVECTRAALAANGYVNYTDEAFVSSGATGTNSLTWGGTATTAVGITFAIKPNVPATIPQLFAPNAIAGQTNPPLIHFNTGAF
jgi:hypothetical protein